METFDWQHLCFNVTKINEAIASGQLIAQPITIGRQALEWYVMQVLGFNAASKLYPQMADINREHALGLSEARRQQPVVLVRFPTLSAISELSTPLSGVLCCDVVGVEAYAPNVVVIDGNHRIAAAYMDKRPQVGALLLTLEQLEQRGQDYFTY
jgi:hypothetical protein